MADPTPSLPEDFITLKARVDSYMLRAANFPFRWGLTNGQKDASGFPLEFFRYDARRFEALIERVEHFIRCLIIWLAYVQIARLSPEELDAMAGDQPLMPLPVRSKTSSPIEPIHPEFALRALPLYEPRLPAFALSQPAPAGQNTNRKSARTSARKSFRLRNDDILASGQLVERMGRLTTLFDQIEHRADRYARYWVRRLRHENTLNRKIMTARMERAEQNGTLPNLSDLNFPALKPLPDWHPPDALSWHAPEDEAKDLSTLHQTAFRAAELFTEHCR